MFDPDDAFREKKLFRADREVCLIEAFVKASTFKKMLFDRDAVGHLEYVDDRQTFIHLKHGAVAEVGLSFQEVARRIYLDPLSYKDGTLDLTKIDTRTDQQKKEDRLSAMSLTAYFRPPFVRNYFKETISLSDIHLDKIVDEKESSIPSLTIPLKTLYRGNKELMLDVGYPAFIEAMTTALAEGQLNITIDVPAARMPLKDMKYGG